MVMVADLLAGLNRFLSAAELKDSTLGMVSRLFLAFLLHTGRMSCLQAAGADGRTRAIGLN